jgi:O-antigen/teichoic acid export membrane protein
MAPGALVRDSLRLTISQLLARAALLGRAVVAMVALGPGGFGSLNALNLILDYGAYAPCGVLQGLDLELPAAAELGAAAEAAALLRGAWLVVVVGGALFAIGLVAFLSLGAGPAAHALGWGPPLLMLVAALLQLAILYQGSALRAHGRFGALSAATAAQALVGGAAGIALVWRFGIGGLIAGWIAGGVVALAMMRRAWPAPLVPGAPARGRALLGLGLPVFAYFLASLVMRSVDRMAFLRFGTPESLGLYSLGITTAGLVLYLPESAGSVLYPRIAAAAHGARDLARTRAEVDRAQRALVLVLPPAVAFATLWAAPVIAAVPRLQAYAAGVPALQILATGALLLGAGAIPGYLLLGFGRSRQVLVVALAGAVLTATLVFGTAARDPRPAPVALAAASGYLAFAAAIVALAARELRSGAADRLRFVVASLLPALWAGALVLALSALGSPADARAALLRSVALALGYLPVLAWLGRGIGLGSLARDWLTGLTRPAPA